MEENAGKSQLSSRKPEILIISVKVVLVILFWLWRLLKGDKNGLRFWYIKSINRRLKRFTPYQLIVATLTSLYAIRHFDALLGLQAPEPLAHLYSRSYYRATWISNALDAGFATAMSIHKPKWLKDLAGPVFGLYYLIWTEQAEEKLLKFRATCTVEFLRSTGEKLSNPYIRAATILARPRCNLVREILLPRPKSSKYTKPISCLMLFNGTKEELSCCTELVIDFPGGAFVFMTPRDHEERLRWWAKEGKKKVVLSVNYIKSPEYPFPWAIDEAFDLYKIILETNGRLLDMKSDTLNILLAGDSAGGNANKWQILESEVQLKHPVGIVLTYPALDFNFTSWMSDENLEVLRTEQSSASLASLFESKDHLAHKSPLSITCDIPSNKNIKRQKSWSDHLSHWASSTSLSKLGAPSPKIPYSAGAQIASAAAMQTSSKSTTSLKDTTTSPRRRRVLSFADSPPKLNFEVDEQEVLGIAVNDDVSEERDRDCRVESEKPLYERVIAEPDEHVRKELQKELEREHMEANKRINNKKKAPIGTRLTMTSRTGFFNDRIIPPSVMRACALLYIGPKNRPDFKKDYYLSPILAPSYLLEQFPTTLIVCGERDPFVDDSLIFAGRLRKAKLARQSAALQEQANYENSTEVRTPTGGLGLGIADIKDNYVEDPIVHEDEDDWVHLRIIEGMSHGFLQMTGVVSESLLIIKKLNQWIEESFLNAIEKVNASRERDEELEKQAKEEQSGKPVQSNHKHSESEYELSEPLVFSTKKSATPSMLSEPATQIHTPMGETFSHDQPPPQAKPKQIRTHSTPPAQLPLKSNNLDHRGKSFEKDKKNKEDMNSILLSEAEVMRRRRIEAVMGMGETGSANISSDEDETSNG
ncbi:hypothetical protein E3P92_02080 [Wallemia ichthyophaga]|uniref:Alpha/beta hydrolase fold-3 domain-containing protein n=1 Tax=Wallemia ichthyophaga TaxID=245174 RepID=A0A4T0ED87_WALIC|nr:hypothetical protein E3P91_02161 [Wallemia ichthyophaga]TIA84545.1 hypothetical protein E3P98_00099 [Wallemia ichthyophaga]TIA89525.1 hypothetical protein E3P97_02979 [Wallemia ichthyophaga]TIB12744.1 hypothetical protein E3P90_01858 [Wallemia ichthyophaga]TIB14252.1 hypothetical protein E3P92_02080 [Wallemia ichthyophaga]